MTSVTVNLSKKQTDKLQALCDHCNEPMGEFIQRIVAVFLDPEQGERAYYRKLKRRLQKARNHRCEVCGGRKGLKIHHCHYRTRFYESLDDLRLVCRECQSAFQERAKNKALERKDIPLIDPKMNWLVDKIRRTANLRPEIEMLDARAVDEKNYRFEADFAADLKAKLDALGKRSVTDVEAYELTGMVGVDVTAALLRELVLRHDWIRFQAADNTWHYSPYDDADASASDSATRR